MTEVVRIIEQSVTVVQAAQPGLPGPPDVASLKVYNRLGEFDTPEARAAARANLELQHIDCGEF